MVAVLCRFKEKKVKVSTFIFPFYVKYKVQPLKFTIVTRIVKVATTIIFVKWKVITNRFMLCVMIR
jgi:hypothetical protein